MPKVTLAKRLAAGVQVPPISTRSVSCRQAAVGGAVGAAHRRTAAGNRTGSCTARTCRTPRDHLWDAPTCTMWLPVFGCSYADDDRGRQGGVEDRVLAMQPGGTRSGRRTPVRVSTSVPRETASNGRSLPPWSACSRSAARAPSLAKKSGTPSSPTTQGTTTGSQPQPPYCRLSDQVHGDFGLVVPVERELLAGNQRRRQLVAFRSSAWRSRSTSSSSIVRSVQPQVETAEVARGNSGAGSPCCRDTAGRTTALRLRHFDADLEFVDLGEVLRHDGVGVVGAVGIGLAAQLGRHGLALNRSPGSELYSRVSD